MSDIRSYDEILNAQRSLLARMAGSMQGWSFNDAGDIPIRLCIAMKAYADEDAELRIEMGQALAIEQAQTIARYSK